MKRLEHIHCLPLLPDGPYGKQSVWPKCINTRLSRLSTLRTVKSTTEKATMTYFHQLLCAVMLCGVVSSLPRKDVPERHSVPVVILLAPPSILQKDAIPSHAVSEKVSTCFLKNTHFGFEQNSDLFSLEFDLNDSNAYCNNASYMRSKY